jgi:hypothetical protein
MASPQERRQCARSERAGTVSRFAQRRVDERVMEIMSARNAGDLRGSSSDRVLSERPDLRRSSPSPTR